MQKYSFCIFGREYRLYSLQNGNKKLSENEISLYATENEKHDFAFDFCDTPPALCALLVGYFIFFLRGVPLSDIILASRGEVYKVERNGAYVTVQLPRRELKLGKINVLGVDTEYADTENGRIVYFENLPKLDKTVLTGLLIFPGADVAKKMLAVTGRGDSVRLYGEGDFDMLYAVAKFLCAKGILKSKIRAKYKNDSLIFTYENGIIKVGILPKIIK